jgi:ABC-2 type transport system permease protein
MKFISLARVGAVFWKELIQMRRDRFTFAIMVGVPVIQIVMFGYAVNFDPRHLPTAIIVRDGRVKPQEVINVLEKTGYFKVVRQVADTAQGRKLIEEGTAVFAVTVPEHFMDDLEDGLTPHIIVDADASDPVTAANAAAAISLVPERLFSQSGPYAGMGTTAPFDVVVHKMFNPDSLTSFSIVPGLIGVILTQTMVLITALAVMREVERGTMENLMAMPLRPLEIMIGKMLPYVAIGYAQVILVLLAAHYLFQVPILGSYLSLIAAVAAFILANLGVGFVIAALSANALQAMQASFFFFLPSVMLTGFMFPFRGMPAWAQWLGETLPNTHFTRIVRGLMLKGNDWSDIANDVWALIAFLGASVAIAMLSYRRTLD